MRTLNNNIVLNNNLKSGKSDSIIDTIKLLAKLGLLETKKKKIKPKLMIEGGPSDSFGGPRQNNKMAQVVTYGPSEQDKKASGEFTKSGPTISGIPTIEDINREKQAVQQKANLAIENGQDIKQFQLQLANLDDKLQKTKEELLYQQMMGENRSSAIAFNVGRGILSNIQSQKFRSDGPTVEEIDEEKPKFSQSEEPFKGVKGEDSGAVYDIDEQDFTNQGSQDLPDTVKQVDVSATPSELLEDEQTTDFIPMKEEPEMKVPAKEEEKIVQSYNPFDQDINNITISTGKMYFTPFMLDAMREFEINPPEKKGWKKQSALDYVFYLDGLSRKPGSPFETIFEFPKGYEKLDKTSLEELIRKNLIELFFNFQPTSFYNKKTRRWELAE